MRFARVLLTPGTGLHAHRPRAPTTLSPQVPQASRAMLPAPCLCVCASPACRAWCPQARGLCGRAPGLGEPAAGAGEGD